MEVKTCLDDQADNFSFLRASKAEVDKETKNKIHGIVSFAPANGDTASLSYK